MVRWYDYIVAFIVADVLATLFFSVPLFGAILAYVLYEYGWDSYCKFRLERER